MRVTDWIRIESFPLIIKALKAPQVPLFDHTSHYTEYAICQLEISKLKY